MPEIFHDHGVFLRQYFWNHQEVFMNAFLQPMSYRQFLKYITPSILTMIFLSFYTTIDGFFVSRYAGSDALAGINIVIPVTCMIFGTAVMLATGAGAMIGEYMGRNQQKKASEIFSFLSCALLIFSALFSAAGIMWLRPIAFLLGASERLMEHVLPYGFVVFAGTIPMAFKLFFEYLVRTDGSPQTALYMSVAGLILNVILDYVFVGVLRWGTFGAAVGTVCSISVSAAMGLYYFLKKSRIRFTIPKASAQILWKACVNGSSEMLTELSTGITTFLFNLIIMQKSGEDGVAAVTILMYIYYFFIAFYMGITVASAPVVSYNLGAFNPGKIRETLKYSFLTIGITAAMIMGILLAGGNGIIHLFTDSSHVYELTAEALRYFRPVFLFIGVNVFLSGYFTALGDGVTSAVISSLRSLIFVVIFILILPPFLGIRGIWLTMPLAESLTIVVSAFLYNKKGRPEKI